MDLRELCSQPPQYLHVEATFLEEYAAWAPEALTCSFEEKTRPEIETRLVDTGLRPRTGGGECGKEF